MCTKYKVTFESISVVAIDDGLFGGDLEARFTFFVNGQTKVWDRTTDDVGKLGVGVTNIGTTFFVDVPVASSVIHIEVSGIEIDDFHDDNLAGFTKVWTQSDNWGQGFNQQGANNDSITYNMNYTIGCATKATHAISRQALVRMAEVKANARRIPVPSSLVLLNSSLDRLNRAGWTVMTASGDELLVEGYGNLPLLIEERFGEQRKQ